MSIIDSILNNNYCSANVYFIGLNPECSIPFQLSYPFPPGWKCNHSSIRRNCRDQNCWRMDSGGCPRGRGPRSLLICSCYQRGMGLMQGWIAASWVYLFLYHYFEPIFNGMNSWIPSGQIWFQSHYQEQHLTFKPEKLKFEDHLAQFVSEINYFTLITYRNRLYLLYFYSLRPFLHLIWLQVASACFLFRRPTCCSMKKSADWSIAELVYFQVSPFVISILILRFCHIR